MRFENAAGDGGDGAVAGAIEAGDSGVELFVEVELCSDPQRRADEQFLRAQMDLGGKRSRTARTKRKLDAMDADSVSARFRLGDFGNQRFEIGYSHRNFDATIRGVVQEEEKMSAAIDRAMQIDSLRRKFEIDQGWADGKRRRADAEGVDRKSGLGRTGN